MVVDTSEADAVMEAVAYAFDKLPISVEQACSLPSLNAKEKLLVYMARYTAWARNSLQMNKTFVNLLGDCPEFAVALLFSSITAPAPPWVIEPVKTASRVPSRWAVSHDSTSHILSRSCGSCDYKGVMSIRCTRCFKYDSDVGLQVVVDGTTVAEVGADRLSGNNSVFTYTCKWCGYRQFCNHNRQLFNFSDLVLGETNHCSSNMGPLVCRKCSVPGWKVKMKLTSAAQPWHYLHGPPTPAR